MSVGDGRADVCIGRKGSKEVTKKAASVPSWIFRGLFGTG